MVQTEMVTTYATMERITHEDYLDFVVQRREVEIERVKVALCGPYHPNVLGPPEEYMPETETVWSFPDRGSWATHAGNYRGNWSPYIPRNVIQRYTELGETVVDQMCGSGTTLVECRLLGRHGIGIDISRDAVMIARDRLYFEYTPSFEAVAECPIDTYVGDARNLDKIDSDAIDLIATHPPYCGIVSYSNNRVEGDLSSLKLEPYLQGMHSVAAEAYRVLKPGKHCVVLIGDTRRNLHYIPISHRVMLAFLDVGFLLREDIIKLQWKTKTTRERWRGSKYAFYKIAHEHLFVFRKPDPKEQLSRYKLSRKWFDTTYTGLLTKSPRGRET